MNFKSACSLSTRLPYPKGEAESGTESHFGLQFARGFLSDDMEGLKEVVDIGLGGLSCGILMGIIGARKHQA